MPTAGGGRTRRKGTQLAAAPGPRRRSPTPSPARSTSAASSSTPPLPATTCSRRPPTGRSTSPGLLADFSDAPSDDQVILHDAGFARGFTRGWLRESPRSFLGVFVFEFAAEEGARTAGERFAAQNASTKQATPFAVESIAGAAGQSYTQQTADGVAERVHVITFVRGSRLYQVGGQFPDGSATVDQTVAFAEAEARLAQ